MLIPTTSSIGFTVFYSLAFYVAFLLLLWEGYKRKIPTIQWVLLLVFCQIFFIVGTKIFTYNQQQWLLIIKHATFEPTTGKILLGGMVLGFPALLAGKYILRIKQDVLDAFAIIFPVSIGIQRLGCFLNGCCFGTPTTLLCGVQYPVNTLPHYHHFESGLIGTNDLLSLQIHPVQLYEMAGVLFAAFIVFKTRKVWKAKGSLFMFSTILYFLVRMITEFFRDNLAHSAGGKMVAGLNLIQWIMLISIVIFSFVLLYREMKNGLKTQPNPHSSNLGIQTCLLIFTSEALLCWAVRYWFTYSEIIALTLIFLTSGILFFYRILEEIASSQTKMIYAGLLILPLLITGQTIPQAYNDSSKFVKTKKVSFGLSTGNIENAITVKTGTSSDGCDQYDTEYFKQKYILGGAGYSVEINDLTKNILTNYGLNIYIGQNNEVILSDNSETKTFLFGLNPFYKFDAKWIGAGVGLHAGSLAYQKFGNDKTDLTTAIKKTPVYPQLYCRIGPRRILFMDYHLADHFPAPFPGFMQQLGIGSGFGAKNNTYIRAGFFLPARDDPFANTPDGYFSAYLPINKDLSLEPMLVLAGQKFTQFSFGLHYNLSVKPFTKKSN